MLIPFLYHILDPLPAFLQLFREFFLSLQLNQIELCHLQKVQNEVGSLLKLLPQLIIKLLTRSFPLSDHIRGSLGVPAIAIFGWESSICFIFGVAMSEAVKGVPVLSAERVALGFLGVFGDEDMFEIGNLFSILPKFDVL